MEVATTKKDLKAIIGTDTVKQKFQEMLGKKSAGFLVSLLNLTQNNELLAKADPNSVIYAAATAASLDLPIEPNLGFAYILPYNKKQKDGSYKNLATFQLGYKGFIQLALRSGQFKTISKAVVYEGQLIDENPLTGYVFDFKQKKSDKIIGYASYFELINGFASTLYMSVDECRAHGLKFSQTMKKGYGLWVDSFDDMSLKTVLKLNLAKYAPLSIEMQRAIVVDQSVVNDFEAQDVSYVDNEADFVDAATIVENKERTRIIDHIKRSTTKEQLMGVNSSIDESDEEMFDLFTKKLAELQ